MCDRIIEPVPPLLPVGVYPASVTPFDGRDAVDEASLARLTAYFESTGCAGVVLAGTNGEGPSLSSYEKRDLLRAGAQVRGGLKLILGIATPSLSEARWLCRQAAQGGADAVLVMAPGYFRSASEEGVADWFMSLLDSSPVPVLVYNFPKYTGFEMSAEFMGRLAGHTRFAGVKDSSGSRDNLTGYKKVLSKEHVLFVGDETLLAEALACGWTGTISGAANIVPRQLCALVSDWARGDESTAMARFALVEPVVRAIRQCRQPATSKAVLAALGILDNGVPRLPLTAEDPATVLAVLEERLGIQPGRLGLSAP